MGHCCFVIFILEFILDHPGMMAIAEKSNIPFYLKVDH